VDCERRYTLLKTFLAMKMKNGAEEEKWHKYSHGKAKQGVSEANVSWPLM
jgi:hypothetical protein